MKRILLVAILFCSFIGANAQYLILQAPTGGETFAIGSSQIITWASIGLTEIDIEYSSNNGATYSIIDTNVNVFNNNYTWLVAGPVTSNGFIRIKQSNTGNYVSVNTTPFSVVNPFLQITYPTLASVFNPGQQVNISWSGFIVSNNVSLLFSADNGTTYDTIVSDTTNFNNFDWIVPSIASTTCKIKIIDAAAPLVQNISDVFTIEALPSSGAILTPNGGENLFSTTNFTINWNVAGTSIIDLEYTPDGGANWINIAQNIAATPSNFDWTVPSLNSSTVKVRLKNAINGLVLDESNNYFTITQPTPSLYLYSPFGYENWAIGSTQSIQWNYSFVNSIKIEYSTDGGTNFNLISGNIPAADLSYNWIVPTGSSSNCIIRISDNNSAITSQNQNPFSIVNPSITLLTPNGGEVFNANVDTIISWNGNLISNQVKLEYSINNGTAWNLIATNQPNNNFYTWHVPVTPSTACKVRISDAQFPGVNDQSNSNFTITPPTPIVNLISPNGGEQWGIGTNQTIFWNTNNVANVKIEYSIDNGTNWIIINPLVPASANSYTWLVSAIPSSNGLIKVSDAANNAVNDISASVIEFYTPTSFLDLLTPNGGEEYSAGFTSAITWTSQNVNAITIEYSINNGISWQTISSGIQASSGTFNWDVPYIYSSFVKIRIRDVNNVNLNDQSAGYFSIIEPTINFTSFPIGNTFTLFSSINLVWNSNGLNNQLLRLEYSVNNGINWVTIASGMQNTGSYNWLINCQPNTSCKFKISAENEQSVFDTTAGSINVISNGPAITILGPTQPIISAGSVVPITWYSYGINYVRIEYSINGNPIYQLLTAFTPASLGLYYWNVPANLNATQCNIRISNAANTNLFAQTPFSFIIQNGSYFVSTGNSNAVLFSGQNHQIAWQSNANSSYVNIDYSTDSLNWTSIESNFLNTGTYNWIVPPINADSVWYRIQDGNNASLFDINNQAQTIILVDSTIELTSPSAGDIILSGSTLLITWNALGLNLIDIEFSADSGTTWNTIASNVDANLGSFLWNVPMINTVNAFIKIKNSNYFQQFAQNQNSFEINDATLEITTPNGGESWNTNQAYYITWQSIGINFIDLLYSNDGGTNYNIIDTNIFNQGYYLWQTPVNPGSNFKIKIADSYNQYFYDESNNAFTLTNATPSIDLISPSGGEQLISNSGSYITWQSEGISNIDISYSLNGGASYNTIANNVPAIPAYYFWLVPDTQTDSVKIKIVSSNNAALNDVSNSNFSIVNNNEVLTLITPDGGETFNANSFQTIKWYALNVPYVKLSYSTNGGASYNYINAIYNDSIYVWQVPNLGSNFCKIKIENGNDPSLFDITNTNFTINNQLTNSNSITIDSISNTNICAGANIPVSISTVGSFAANNNFRVHLSDPFGSFNTFTDIGGTVADTNATIQCQIPLQAIASNNYTIRVVADNPAVISTNYNFGNITINSTNAEFTVDKELVLFPNTTVNFQPSASSSAISNSIWNTGNAGNYNGFNAQHTYSAAGKYDITHTVTDTSACNSTKTKLKFISVEHWFPNMIINSSANQEIVDINFENERYGCAILKNGNCLTTSDSGKTWSLSYTNSGSIVLTSICIFNNTWYITTQNGTYLKSTNKGSTWIPITFNNNDGINDLVFIANNNAYIAGNNGKLLKYNGTAWLTQNTGTNSILNKIACNNNTKIVVGNDATILKLQNNVWTNITSPVNVNLNSIYFKDSINGYIAGDYGFILKTIDGGLNWNVALAGADVNFSDIIGHEDTLWAIANEGIIYTSLNNGSTWNRYSIGVTEDLNSAFYQHRKGYIVGKNGLLRSFNKPEYIHIPNSINDRNENILLHCFPNPTTNNLNISFTEDIYKDISLKIIDIHGKVQIEKKINKSNSDGTYTIDVSSFPDGIYFMTIITEQKNQTLKFIKTK